MAFSIPVALSVSGLPKALTKTVTLSEEINSSIEITVPASTSDYAVPVDIDVISKLKLLAIVADSPIKMKIGTGNIGAKGWQYDVLTMILLGDSVHRLQHSDGTPLTQIQDLYFTNTTGSSINVRIVVVESV